MVGPTAKKFKIALAKTPYNSLKKVKSGAVKKIIQNLILKVFLLIPYFLEESLKVNKNYPKHHSFHITFSPKKRHLFYKLQLTQYFKKYAPGTQPKTLLILQIFQQTFILHLF